MESSLTTPEREPLIHSRLLSEIPGLRHGFGTRHFPHPAEVRTLRQVHSARVVFPHEYAPSQAGDALIADQPDVLVGVRTADCVPILVFDPAARVAAAIHAGWRGTAAQILAHALRRLAEVYGSCPQRLVLAIGPAIGPCCYEVDAAVQERFAAWFPEWDGLQQRRFLDLQEANRRQALQAGIPEHRLDVIRLCTKCRPERFHSFRRDGKACGRMLSFIGFES